MQRQFGVICLHLGVDVTILWSKAQALELYWAGLNTYQLCGLVNENSEPRFTFFFVKLGD